MNEIYIKDYNCTLSYDPSKGVLKDGEPTKDFHPAFIGNPDGPEFFGYESPDHKVLYDIYGGVSNIISENDIKL